MLDWLLGRQVEDANRDDGRKLDKNDAPDTPAPVFAARAFKSAIFGTPGFRDEDDLEKPQQPIGRNGEIKPAAQVPYGSSPTKPQGILLTPGTATSRRKTVSFGAGVVDNEGKDVICKSGVPNDCPGKFPSPYTPKAKADDNMESARRTALIETLEAARDGKSKKSSSVKTTVSAPTTSSLDLKKTSYSATNSNMEPEGLDAVQSKSSKRKDTAMIPFSLIEDYDGDMTLDLNEPRSNSGRYWKSEYDRYHEEAIAHMTKLVKYKQLAKSYAKKKDSEAIDLGEKLKEERQKVANMEAKMSELATQIANRRLDGRENENHDLVRDLARQTTLTREYGNQVDEFQIVLQKSHARSEQLSSETSQSQRSTHIAPTSSETDMKLDNTREKLREMGTLRDEMHSLQLNISMAEEKISTLQDENAKLTRDLTKMSEQLDESEKRRLSAEAQNHERQVLFQGLQNDYNILKDLAKSQRRDAEDLLKKRHSQATKLKREIRLLKEEITASNPKATNRVTSNAHGEVFNSKMEEVADVAKPKGSADAEDLMLFDTPPKPEARIIESHSKWDHDLSRQRAPATTGVLLMPPSTSTRYDEKIRAQKSDREKKHLLNSQIPALGLSKEKFESTKGESTRKTDGNVPSRSRVIPKPTALSEIINYAKLDDSPARLQSLPASQLSASFQERFSSLSLNSPDPALPSPEPSFVLGPCQRAQERRGTDSPRPSMINIPSSPPKRMLPRPRSSGTHSHTGRNGNAPSSRVSSMNSRARVALPSDRAAAAKARLAQKNAEKRKVQGMAEEKENIRV